MVRRGQANRSNKRGACGGTPKQDGSGKGVENRRVVKTKRKK